MNELVPNSVVHVDGIGVTLEPVAQAQHVQGTPQTGTAVLGKFFGVEVGIWEMTPGVSTDVEEDEIFIVLSGSATIEFADGAPALHVQCGDVVRLAAGAQTVWTVTATLRKVYLSGR